MLPIMFAMPFIQLIILSYTATYEVKDIGIHWVDYDQTLTSQRLASKLEASGYFSIVDNTHQRSEGVEDLLHESADVMMEIPEGFEEKIRKGQKVSIQCLFDGVQGNKAGVAQSYIGSVIADFSRQVQVDTRTGSLSQASGSAGGLLTVIPRYRYNLELEYLDYMVPGILVVLVSMIGIFLSGMNIVREQELGTIEQLNVTPIKKWQFITGKLLPLWIIGLAELSIGLVIAYWGFEVPIKGSLLLIYGVAAIYLLAMVGLGLLISTINETQQQAMFVAWFLMVVFILMGGLFTPIESMPDWAQKITYANPLAYFIEIMRFVMLKGSDFVDVWKQISVLSGMALLFLGLAVNRYKKSSG